MNAFLLFSWALESLLELIFDELGPMVSYQTPHWWLNIENIITHANMVIFFMTMFKMKSLQIYMDPRN